MSDDEREVALRPDTLAALREFLAEREAARQREEREAEVASAALATTEDWQLSQFWYDEATGRALAEEVLACVRDRGRPSATVALLSCPSTYKALLATGVPMKPDSLTTRIELPAAPGSATVAGRIDVGVEGRPGCGSA